LTTWSDKGFLMMKIEENKLLTLVNAAKEGFENAYAPYSNVHVGAAALTATGKVVKGCNV
jgi:cytidine deaminase